MEHFYQNLDGFSAESEQGELLKTILQNLIVDEELKIAKNFQKSWEKEIDKIQAKLGIFPKNLKLLFTQAENLIEEVNDIQLKFKEEFSNRINMRKLNFRCQTVFY